MTATVEIDAPVLAAVALEPEVPDDLPTRLARRGLWWMVPFARTGLNGVIGVRAIPGVPLGDSPIVRRMNDSVGTVASSARVLVPVLVFEHLRGPGDYWSVVARWPADHWEQLGRLHAALGGGEELETLRRILLDEPTHRGCTDESKGVVQRFRALVGVQTTIDPSRELKTSVAYRLDALEREEAPVPLPDAGWLGQSVAMTAFVVSLEAGHDDRAFAAAWEVQRESPDLDGLGPGDLPSPWQRPYGDGGKTQLEAAALLVRRAGQAPPEWRSDPLWSAVESMAALGERYDGSAHLVAASELPPERAFAALTVAGHFRGRTGGEGANEPLDAARALCVAEGWTELAALLGRGG